MNHYFKLISLQLCLLCLLSMTCISCGSRSSAAAVTLSTITLDDLCSKIEQAAGKLPKMDCYTSSDQDAKGSFEYLCDFDYSKVDDYYISYASNGSADEIFLIKLKDSHDSTNAELSLHARIKSRTIAFDQYQPEEVYKLSNAIVTANGNYVALLICQDEYSAKKAFQDAFSTKEG